jgi:D-xylulose reductase
LGLLILAVAKAYGVRKIVIFDIEQARVDFAVKYGADAGSVPPMKPENVDSLAYAQQFAKQVIEEHDVKHGFDVAIEASGAEICAQMAVCIAKNGGTCKCLACWTINCGMPFYNHSLCHFLRA